MLTYINVRVGRLPGRIMEIVLNGARTVAAALETASLSAEGFDIRVQGQPSTLTTELHDGDIVLLVKKIKGNADGFISASVARVPGLGFSHVALEYGATIGGALSTAEIEVADDEVVFRNCEPASFSDSVVDGDEIVVKRQAPASPASAKPAVDEDDDESSKVRNLRKRAESLREETINLYAKVKALKDLANAYESCEDEGINPESEALEALVKAYKRCEDEGINPEIES